MVFEYEKNNKHINYDQKEKMVAFMLAHKDLAAGKITGNNYKETTDDLYQQLTKILNSVPNGARKDPEGWRRSWVDFKRNTTSKEMQRRKFLREKKGEEIKMSEVEETLIEQLVPKERFGTDDVPEMGLRGYDQKKKSSEKETQIKIPEIEEKKFFLTDEDSESSGDDDKKDVHLRQQSSSGNERNQDSALKSDLTIPSTSGLKRKNEFHSKFFKRNKSNSIDQKFEEEGESENKFSNRSETKDFKLTDKSASDLLRRKVELKEKDLELKEQKLKLEKKRNEILHAGLTRIADQLEKQNEYLRNSS